MGWRLGYKPHRRWPLGKRSECVVGVHRRQAEDMAREWRVHVCRSWRPRRYFSWSPSFSGFSNQRDDARIGPFRPIVQVRSSMSANKLMRRWPCAINQNIARGEGQIEASRPTNRGSRRRSSLRSRVRNNGLAERQTLASKHYGEICHGVDGAKFYCRSFAWTKRAAEVADGKRKSSRRIHRHAPVLSQLRAKVDSAA